jgi:hypothetical protein
MSATEQSNQLTVSSRCRRSPTLFMPTLESVLEQADRWLCRQRRDYTPDADMWTCAFIGTASGFTPRGLLARRLSLRPVECRTKPMAKCCIWAAPPTHWC